MSTGASPDSEKGQPDIGRAALSGLCPRCGAPTLFEAPARIAMKCEACKLDFAPLERGSRFAGMATMIVAILLIMLAMGVDIWLRPPFWLQVVFWAPVTIAVVIGFLRFYKTTLLYRQYEEQQEKGEP